MKIEGNLFIVFILRCADVRAVYLKIQLQSMDL